jgi:hypothetical protein
LFDSSLVLGEDAFLSSTDTGDFIFLNTINSQFANQPRSLSVVGQERIVFEALAGGTAKLKSASLNAGGQLAVNAGIQTFGGDINLTSTAGTVVLTGATDTTGSANLLGGAVNLDGADEVIFKGGTITTFGGAVGVTGPAFINTATTITTSGGGLGDGDVTFGGTLNGFTPLTVTAGTGALTFTGAVGGTSPFDITISSAGGVTFSGATLLGSGATSITSQSGNVTFGNTLDKLGGTFEMVLGTRTATFTGAVGGTNPFGMSVDFSGGVTFSQAVNMGGDFEFSNLSGAFLASGVINSIANGLTGFALRINPVNTTATVGLNAVGTTSALGAVTVSSGSVTVTTNCTASVQSATLVLNG